MELREDKTDQFTLTSGHLDVGGGHQVYFEQWGNKEAETPILCFHGGPGSQYKNHHKQNFDPARHQLILFDQRGSGNSLPYGRLENNTTQDLVADSAKILDHLNIEKVYVYGGSWGSTMSLLFTIEHPTRVKAVVIQAIFTGTQDEIDYLDKGYFERFYPEVWERFQNSVPDQNRQNPAEYHYQMLNGEEKDKLISSAKAFEDLEFPLLLLDWPGFPSSVKPLSAEEYDYVPYRIYAQYLSNACYLPNNYIMNNASSIDIPTYIVQGRYDMACPPKTAHTLHKAIPHSKLFITLGSHRGSEADNRTVLKSLIETVFI